MNENKAIKISTFTSNQSHRCSSIVLDPCIRRYRERKIKCQTSSYVWNLSERDDQNPNLLAPKSSLISVSSPPKNPTLQRRRVSFGFKEGVERHKRVGSGRKHDTPDYGSETNSFVFRGPGSASGFNQVKVWITMNLILWEVGVLLHIRVLTGGNLRVIVILKVILTAYIIPMNGSPIL